MSDRYPGGIITKTPVTPAGPYAEGAAPGVWTLEQQAYWAAQGLWPNANNPTPNDPYFQYVTSLLHGDGTNGGQNNTFLDSSTNAFTITRNGNTTQGSFSPYGSNWGNYFNGSSYLTTPSSITLGSGDLTIEGWISPANTSGTVWYDFRGSDSGSAGNNPVIQWSTVTSGKFTVRIDGTNAITSSSTFSVGAWYHVALVRSGTTVTLYVNGISQGTYTTSTNFATAYVRIGAYGGDGTLPLTGYSSNLRAVVGTAVYTSNFTPSTAPLTAISGTQLLTCQANRFVDASTNAYTLTINGTPQVTRFSPFAPTYATQYSTSTIGGSGYFDGSGDYLTVAGTSQFEFGTGDFTIEYWVYPTALDCVPVGQTYNASNYAIQPFVNSGTGSIELSIGATSNTTSNGAVVLNQWNHVAIVRSGTTLQVLTNGTSKGSWTYSSNAGDNATMGIGARPSGNYLVNGYVSNVRIVKGTALYSGSTYTIPTAPLTAVANTSLLCNMTNGAIYDNAETLDWETVGNAQISTSVKKYGTGSLAFDGSGDRLVSQTSNQLVNFGTSNFTIEAWIYPTTLNFYHSIINNDAGTSSGARGFSFSVNSSNGLSFFYSTNGTAEASIDSPNSIISTNTWYHVAVSKVGTATKIFLNGTQVASGTISNINFASAYPTMIGDNPQTTTPFYGYIDDLRVTRGYARYWENFTPPAAALPNFGGAYQVPTQDPQFNYTTLLLPGNGTNGAQNNTFLDSSTNAFTITRNGNTTQGTFTPFSQTGWSANLVGGASGGYLTSSTSSDYAFGTGDFTIEGWVFITGTGTGIFQQGTSNFPGSSSNSLALGTNGGTPTWQIYAKNTNTNSTATWVANNWYHFALVRSGTNTNLYINGTSVIALTGDSTNYTGTYFGIGSIYGTGSSERFTGNVSNVRVVKGAAVYTANFTPPTSSLTAYGSGTTALLALQSNRFVDNSPSPKTLTVTDSISVQAFSPFAPTAPYSTSTVGGSGYFDRTGDYLTAPNNSAFQFGTGDFTIECWVYYLTAPTTGQGIFFIGSDYLNGTTAALAMGSDGGTGYLSTYYGGGTNTNTSYLLKQNTWTHIAMVRSSGTLKAYANGVEVFSVSDSTNYTYSYPAIGGWYTTSYLLNGYISNFRIVKGTAVYTSAFTPPTAPLTAITNTSLLLSCTNAGITDATAKNDLETVGNAQISNTTAKFGSTSIAFDGNGDVLSVWSAPKLFNLGTGDFTLEMWINFTSTQSCHIFATNDGVGNDSPTGYFYFSYEGGSIYAAKGGGGAGNFISYAWTPTTGQWYHMAVSRTSSEMMLFINGQKQSVSTTGSPQTFNFVGDNHATIGVGVSSNYFDGYIQDLRLTKGYARYVQPFTPPTQAFQLY